MENYQLIATGRLRMGRLHGFVVMNGMVTNDPKSPCAQSVFHEGLGFIGHFKDGIPHGVCWRGLTGGAWIYGEVNDEGLFTGKIVSHFVATKVSKYEVLLLR
jgi:hypothetical protein